MNNKINIEKYFKKIRYTNNSHVYIEQDYGYDEYGNFYSLNCHKIRIIKNGEILYKRDICFSSFSECEKIAISKCKELSINPDYIIFDKNREDEVIRIKTA